MLHTTRVTQERDLRPLDPLDSQNLTFDASADGRARNRDPATGEATPVGSVPQGAFDPWRRHFQHVLLAHQPRCVEPGLERPRHLGAIVNRHLRTVAPVDANIEERTARSTAAPELDQVEAQRVNLLSNEVFERVQHIPSKYRPKNKKMRGNPPPHFRIAGNFPAKQR